jgi:hypothetical protein
MYTVFSLYAGLVRRLVVWSVGWLAELLSLVCMLCYAMPPGRKDKPIWNCALHEVSWLPELHLMSNADLTGLLCF